MPSCVAMQKHSARKRAHGHKARVTQAQLAGNTNRQIQGDRHHDVHADGHQLSLQGIG